MNKKPETSKRPDPNYILATGGPGHGFDFFGPFETHDDAIAEAEARNLQDAWYVCPLLRPKTGAPT